MLHLFTLKHIAIIKMYNLGQEKKTRTTPMWENSIFCLSKKEAKNRRVNTKPANNLFVAHIYYFQKECEPKEEKKRLENSYKLTHLQDK